MTSPSRHHTSVEVSADFFSLRCFSFHQYVYTVVLCELAIGIGYEGMYGSAGDITPISMTGKYDNATASSIKGFKKILAGVTQRFVPFVCCKDSYLIPLCDRPTEHDLGCDGVTVSVGSATDLHGQDPTVASSPMILLFPRILIPDPAAFAHSRLCSALAAA